MNITKLQYILTFLAISFSSISYGQVPADTAETTPSIPEKKIVNPEKAYKKWGNAAFLDFGFGAIITNVHKLGDDIRSRDSTFSNLAQGMPYFSIGFRRLLSNRGLVRVNINGGTQRHINANISNRFSTIAVNYGIGFDLVKNPRWFVAPTLNVGFRVNFITRTFAAGTFDSTLQGGNTGSGAGAYLNNSSINFDAGLTLSYLFKNVDDEEDMARSITIRMGYHYTAPSSNWENFANIKNGLEGPNFGFQGAYLEVLLPIPLGN